MNDLQTLKTQFFDFAAAADQTGPKRACRAAAASSAVAVAAKEDAAGGNFAS
jgi:hypothetical protein